MESDLRTSVLLVDDESANLLALEAILQGPGLNLVKARSGRDALRQLLNEDFALILMDVRMPGMDGFETAAVIRQRERSQHTPIIFLTAYEADDVQMFRGYSLGAVDYLCKPLVPDVLRSKVAVFVDIFQKTAEVKRQSELIRQIEQREHERQLAEAKWQLETERLREEIRLARQIQQKLFPAAPLPLSGFDIFGASYPAEATGGDYFDYIPIRDGNGGVQDGSLGLVIGDVSGHGYGPALLMAEMRAYLRAFLLTRWDVGEILTLVNRALAGDTEDLFATLLLGQLDRRSRSFTYASAGHVTGYVFDASGKVRLQIKSTGMPLAIMPDTVYEAASPITLDPGDLIFLLTDGIIEAHSPDDVLFGLERTQELIRTNQEKSAREIVDTLYTAVHWFCGARAQFDDMTTIIIKVATLP